MTVSRHISSHRLSLNFLLAVDQELLDSERPPVPDVCDHADCGDLCWKNYPTSRFPNWIDPQVLKCGIKSAVDKIDPCQLYYVDVDNKGEFTTPQEELVEVNEYNIEQSWKAIVANKVCPVLMSLLQLSLIVVNFAAPAQPQSKSRVHRQIVRSCATNARSKVGSSLAAPCYSTIITVQPCSPPSLVADIDSKVQYRTLFLVILPKLDSRTLPRRPPPWQG